MTWRASRTAKRLASVAVSASCQYCRPKRRESSPATQSESSVGSIVVMPRAACAAMAAAGPSGEWPVIAPVSPRQKSMYSCPSTQVNRAPCASAT